MSLANITHSALMSSTDGPPVKVIPDLTEITVREAASILGMSTDRLNRLLDENLIESRNEGEHGTLEYPEHVALRHGIPNNDPYPHGKLSVTLLTF